MKSEEIREIKFRAWINGKMEYNICVGRHSKDAPDCKINTVVIIDDGDCWFPNEPFVNIMQYTCFKDKNKKEIWESDLIKYGEMIYEVRWKFNKWIMFNSKFPEYNNFTQPIVGPSFNRNKIKHIEIVGNIYENPKHTGENGIEICTNRQKS